MGTENVKFVRAPGVAATTATGVSISGPTPDGNMHLTFFRDVQFPDAQTYEVRDVQSNIPSDVHAHQLVPAGDPTMKYEKEIVAIVSLTPAGLEQVGSYSTRMADFVKGVLAKPDGNP
jgi:hypothetical protein